MKKKEKNFFLDLCMGNLYPSKECNQETFIVLKSKYTRGKEFEDSENMTLGLVYKIKRTETRK